MTKRPPRVRLGNLEANGIAPSVLALVERGAQRRPAVARELRGNVEMRFDEGYAPVWLSFGSGGVVVEDGPADSDGFEPDLVIRGPLPEFVHLVAAPFVGAVPRITDARARRAVAGVARGRVKLEGSQRLGRQLLKLLRI